MLEDLDYWVDILFKQKIGEQISLMNSAPGTHFVEKNFSAGHGGGGWFGMIQEHYVYWALYF